MDDREAYLRIALGFTEEAMRLADAGDHQKAANWWRYAGVLYFEAATVSPDDVSSDGHRNAGECCELFGIARFRLRKLWRQPWPRRATPSACLPPRVRADAAISPRVKAASQNMPTSISRGRFF
jgi:hypothetical protein